MENLSKNNKIVFGIGAAAIALTGGYYYLKSLRSNQEEEGFEDPGYGKNICLYREEAETRKKLVGEVHYDHKLFLLKGNS